MKFLLATLLLCSVTINLNAQTLNFDEPFATRDWTEDGFSWSWDNSGWDNIRSYSPHTGSGHALSSPGYHSKLSCECLIDIHGIWLRTDNAMDFLYLNLKGYDKLGNEINTIVLDPSNYEFAYGYVTLDWRNVSSFMVDYDGIDFDSMIELFYDDLDYSLPITTDHITACDSYEWINGFTYTEDNQTATYTLSTVEGCDSVVTLDLTILHSTTGTDVQVACDAFIWIDGETYTENNNIATHTLVNAVGCDSVVTLDLTILHSTTGTDVQTACDAFTWIDGETYTENNNIATHTLVNAVGCDSVVTLDLTILHSTTATDVQAACDTYTWIDGETYTVSNNTATYTLSNAVGCDSVLTLDLTIHASNAGTDVQTACESYTWMNGITYTESNNTATYTLSNAAGCDSVVTLDLTIFHIDVSTTVAGLTISSNDTGADYQWLDCDNEHAEITGETGKDYTATENGNYAVVVSANGCADTSACVSITTVGIVEGNSDIELKVYPNPTSGMVNIDLGAVYSETTLTVTNVIGQMVSKANYTHAQHIQLEMTGEKGVYFVGIRTGDDQLTVVKVLKQ